MRTLGFVVMAVAMLAMLTAGCLASQWAKASTPGPAAGTAEIGNGTGVTDVVMPQVNDTEGEFPAPV